MNKWILLMIVGGTFIFAGLGNVYALDADENETMEAAARLDRDSHKPGDAKRVEERLEKKFNVADARIDNLRKQGMGYGEIGITLSLASRMSGGINDQNVQKVVDLRQGQSGRKEGWGNVARDLDLRLKPAARDMDDMRQDRREDMREDRSQQRAERREERTERAERSEAARGSVESSMRTHAQVSAGGGSAGAETHGSAGLHGGVGIGRH